MWLLDFNLCNKWDESVGLENPEMFIDQLVFAFFENDPYYPLPLMEDVMGRRLWSAFTVEYLRKSRELLGHPGKNGILRILPEKFHSACIKREEDNIDQGRGHGYREHKG